MEKAISKNGCSIRLTDERWLHITLGHSEMVNSYYDILDTIENPELIYVGDEGELIAVRNITNEKFIVVIYKELTSNDGFVITVYLSNKIQKFNKKKIIWEQKK